MVGVDLRAEARSPRGRLASVNAAKECTAKPNNASSRRSPVLARARAWSAAGLQDLYARGACGQPGCPHHKGVDSRPTGGAPVDHTCKEGCD